MYEMLCLSDGFPYVDPAKPFTPNFDINGAPPKGRLFGVNLNAAPGYSATLKHLIQECLYENPKHRPSIKQLKGRVHAGILATLAAGGGGEPWSDFLPPEPDAPLPPPPPSPPPPPPPPPAPVLPKVRCSYTRVPRRINGKVKLQRCKNMADAVRIGNTRCRMHPRNRFP